MSKYQTNTIENCEEYNKILSENLKITHDEETPLINLPDNTGLATDIMIPLHHQIPELICNDLPLTSINNYYDCCCIIS